MKANESPMDDIMKMKAYNLTMADVIAYVRPGEIKSSEFQAVSHYDDPNYVPHQELRDWLFNCLYAAQNYKREVIFEFLNYHLDNFKGSQQDFIDFIQKETQPARIKRLSRYSIHESNILPVNEMIEDWIGQLGNKPARTLKAACKGIGEYNAIIEWFTTKGLIDPETTHWRDRTKGYKGSLIGYLKALEIKGYTRHITGEELKEIALNDFNLEVGADTIKRTGAADLKHFGIPPIT